MTRMPSRLQTAGLALLVGGLAASAAAATAVAPSAKQVENTLTPTQEQAVSAGFQVAPKGSAAAKAARQLPNPYLADLADLTQADYATWKDRLAAAAAQRASSAAYRDSRRAAARTTAAKQATVVWDEQEPAGTGGSNDTLADAERITTFGTAKAKKNVVRILGENADLPGGPTSALPTVAEDNGSIPLAGDAGLSGAPGGRTTTGTLGDGPNAATNDYDFYAVDVDAGLSLVADTSGSAAGVDTIAAVYDAEGELLAADDDGGTTLLHSKVTWTAETSGTYYVLVAGYSNAGPLPEDPFDSASGAGGADTGAYQLGIEVSQLDRDRYAVQLRPGDVIGGVSQGVADSLTVYRPDGTQMVGSAGLDASSLYPPNSPLPGGGGTTLAYVAEEAGWYVLAVDGAVGDYEVQLEGYRPGAQLDTNKKQTVYLDFEGGRVNTGVWGGPGVRELSPFSAFLAKWGIPRSREAAMITKITASVRKNIRDEVRAGGLNPDLEVEVVNSRNHPEVKGRANVSRVIVGGTIAQSGIETIGIAQYIDPGNYGHEDAALVLLDVLSDPSGPASLNTYLTAASDREKFVSAAVGNVTAHEVGHTVGSYHTDNLSDVVNLMDAGGANFQNLFGVGPDGIGGTADDKNVTFTEDVYTPVEGFTGLEDTKNVTAWAYPAR